MIFVVIYSDPKLKVFQAMKNTECDFECSVEPADVLHF